MDESYDLVESIFSAKAKEGMIAFAAFKATEGDSGEGVMKVASLVRPDGNGYLTLTFILDLEGDSERQARLQSRFRRAGQDQLAARLGPDFEMLLEVPLNPFAESEQFYIHELNLYFQHLAQHERTLLQERIVPAVAQLLDFAFEPLEWVGETAPQGQVARTGERAPPEAPLAARLRGWLGSD